jgi:hypothetical protein
MDALSHLVMDRYTCCTFYDLITGDAPMPMEPRESEPEPVPTNESENLEHNEEPIDDEDEGSEEGSNFEEPSEIILPNATQVGLNESQLQAVASWSAPLSLIWGPPGIYILTLSPTLLMLRKARERRRSSCRS